LTYTFVTSRTQDPYGLAQAKRTSDAPQGTADKYVSSAAAAKFAGVSLVITTSSDCATGALADLLQERPVLRNDSDNQTGTLFDPSKRNDIQNLLVRDGDEMLIAALTSRPDANIDKIVHDTTCSQTDLNACDKALTDLIAATKTYMDAAGAPTYDTLSDGTDPTWAFFTFTGDDVKSLP
jgi:hypothetical protein